VLSESLQAATNRQSKRLPSTAWGGFLLMVESLQRIGEACEPDASYNYRASHAINVRCESIENLLASLDQMSASAYKRSLTI
jgi:hypothetical protein